MLKIRLQRVGRKNDPSFRIIVTDSHRAAKTGSVLEVVGNYDARHGEPKVDAERVKHWLSVGAQVSGTVHNLLVDQKIISGKKVNVLPKKTPIKKEEEAKPEEKTEAVSEADAPAEVPAESEAAPAGEADSEAVA